ncbi:MAG TPA: choice-of-anchor D domain-containing protein [Kofleriaceae bacterium]|nr:choice-of-anchor D domain-containing protein [Kofleriaceae bacterium]
MMRSIIAATGLTWLLASCSGGPPPHDSEPLPEAVTAGVGATLPYVEQEAEVAATNGTILSSRVWRTLAYEASGRKAVQLAGPGKFVEFTLTAPANAMDLRYSIPDAATGGGVQGSATGYNATISLYVNGSKVGTLPLTSLYTWRYGSYQFTNTPTNNPFHFYDDYRTWLGANLPAGTKIKLQVDAGDTAPWYVIDLADFEQVANPIAQPAGSASVVSFGADPTGVADSAPAFDAAIAANHGKTVWIPPGTYNITRHIIVDNITLAGAGPWYSVLHGLGVGVYGNYTSFNGGPGASSNVTLKDFAIFGETTSRVDSDQVNGIGGALSNSTVSDVWIEHTKVGAWLDGPMDRLTITGCRFKNLFADGINFHRGVTNSTVSNTIIRNAGDDGLAMWSETTADANNTFSFNTVQTTHFANGIAIYGGASNNVTDNVVSDTMRQGGGIHYANRFSAVPMSGTNLIARNVINRGGCLDENWAFGVGALWFDGRDGPMTATINVNDNVINDSMQEAVHFIDSQVTGVTFNNLQINGTGSFAMQFQATGAATFNNVTATGVALAGQYDCLGTGFAVNQGAGNTGWNSTPFCGAFPTPPADPGNPNPNAPAANARITVTPIKAGPYTGAALAASPTSLAFGAQALSSTSAAKTVTVNNAGTAAADLSNLATGSADFAIASKTCGASLAVGASCTVSVTFTPSAAGTRMGALSFGGLITVALSGTGTIAGPALTAAPASLDFASQTTGAASAAQTITLANPGSATTTLSNVASTSGEFTIQSNTCGASLAAGASCTLGVAFAPSVSGARTGAITIASNAPGSPLSIALAGTGVVLSGNQARGKPVTASSVNGGFPASNAVDGDPASYWESVNGSFPQSLTVDLGTAIPVGRVILKLPPSPDWQTRTQPFSVATSTDNATFTSRATSSGVFNPAVASNTVTVDFTAVTARFIRVTITANSGWPAGQISEFEVWPGTITTPQVSLTASPTSLSFASQSVGSTSAAQAVTVRNTGTTAAALSSIVTGSAEFAQTNNCGTSLGAGATCTVNVTFTPSAAGARSATLAVNNSGAALAVALTGTGASTGGTGAASNVALGKPITASSTTQGFVAANAVDGSVAGNSYWEGAAVSQLTVDLGADTAINQVIVKLNPDPIWAARTQTYAILGKSATASSFTTLVASAPHDFTPPVSTATSNVTATVRFVQLAFTANTGAPGGQVAEFEVWGFQPDLRVSDVTIAAAHNPPQEGDAITFAAVVSNNGSASTSGASYGVAFQVDGAPAATATSSTAIPVGGSATVTATSTFTGAAGAHTVVASVDTGNAIAETSEANNTLAKAFTIQQVAGPDLQVVSVSPSPASPSAGQAVSFTVAVNNRGTTAVAAGSVARLVVGATTLTGTAGAIAAGATASVALSGTWPAVNGTTTLTATADATNVVAETNESNNTLSRALFIGRGANVPWDEYEAEAGTTTGHLETGSWADGTLSGEASGRQAVTLTGASQSVQWTSRVNANSIVVRYSVPDGTTNALDVFVGSNPSAVARIAVTGDFAWLYSGRTNGDLHLAQNTKDAAHPDPHHMYDEGNALLSANGTATIHPGDVVRLQPVNASPAITVDFIDLEQVAAPIAAPANFVTVGGATQNDIQTAINNAAGGGKAGIYLPPGTYQMTSQITLPAGLTVQGAGMWHTRLVTAGGSKNQSWGFKVAGNGCTFQDFAMFGSYDTRVDGTGRAFDGNMMTGTTIQRVWAEHWVVGGWITGGNNLTFQDIRFRSTMADGINFANGTHNSRVVNSTVRNNGDDGFAMWSTTDLNQGEDFGNVFQNDTAALIWRAAGFAIYGGHDNVIQDSYVYDTLRYPGLTIDNEFIPQFPFSNTTLFTNMTIERCGGRMWWDEDANPAVAQKRPWGAVWLFAADPNAANFFTGIRLTNIDIIDPEFFGVLIQNVAGQAIRDTVFDGVHIVMNQMGDFGVLANDSHKSGLVGAAGAITFKNSSITGSRVTPANMFSKDSVSSGFQYIDGGGNNWTGNR